jgi:succinate dehydrogenase / fumarate reductase membrane anchor subunit
MDRGHTRSPLARANGLGSANRGFGQWWLERVSAVALIPLTLWFVISVTEHAGIDYVTVIAWLRSPLTTTLMSFLLVTLFYHSALGLQVVIEDYVHSRAKLPAIIATRFVCFLFLLIGILATLRIAFSS